MDDTTPTKNSRSDVEGNSALIRDLVPAIVILAISFAGMFTTEAVGFAGAAWAALTATGAVLLVRAEVRRLRRADEYQRTLQLEAMAFGFGVTLLLALAGGLLDAADLGDPRQSLQITFIGGVLAWLGALAVKTPRG